MNSQRNIKFITFGGPTFNFHKRTRELCHQAKTLFGHFFTNIQGFTDADLKNDPIFWNKHGEFIESNPRGYGYWLWKPYIIHKTLELMNDNDILFYVDAGCYLNFTPNSLNRMYEYIDILDNSHLGIISFQMEHLPEYKYTKQYAIDAIYAQNNDLLSGQCMATVIILRKNSHSIELIERWYNYCELYNIINDMKTEENPEFIDHRHDQSIFSLLVKKYGSIKIPDETYFAPNWILNGNNYPIWAVRKRD